MQSGIKWQGAGKTHFFEVSEHLTALTATLSKAATNYYLGRAVVA